LETNLVSAVSAVAQGQEQGSMHGGQLGLGGNLNVPQPLCLG
jgi:hypothetical protein